MSDSTGSGGKAVTRVTGPHAGASVHAAGAAPEGAAGVVVMIHGRGASAGNILELSEPLAQPGFAYVAPSAVRGSWYPFSFMADTDRNQPHLNSALELVSAIVEDLRGMGVPQDRIFLLGFSQGSCLASEWMFRNPGRYGGLIVFSGGLIGPSGTVWEPTGSMEGTPVFYGCSDIDSHIPKARVDESAEVFESMGADVTKRIYPGMGHLVNDDEIAFARAILGSAPGD